MPILAEGIDMRTWVILTIACTLLIFGFSALAHGHTPIDPFLAYADLLSKDDIIAGMQDWEFFCVTVFSEPRSVCSFEPDDDVFSIIYISFLQGVPQTVDFQVKEHTLRVGNLMLLWGRPDKNVPYSAPLLWSGRDGVTASAFVSSAGRPHYLSPVWMVSFTFMTRHSIKSMHQ
jgi:hypothetical protein